MKLDPNNNTQDISMQEWILYYDGACKLCITAREWIGKLDFFKVVTWIPYQGLREPPPGLSWSDLDSAAYIYVRTTGAWYRGFYALKMLSIKLIPLLPFAPLLWLPGAHIIGEATYAWISNHRRAFCCSHRYDCL